MRKTKQDGRLILISYLNSEGNKVYNYATRLQMSTIYKVINFTIE